MRKITLMCFLLLSIGVSSGCIESDATNAEITEEEAKQIVLKEHKRDDNELEFTSVESEEDKYIIQWEIEPIQKGKDSVDKKTGDLKEIESSTGPCKWF